MLLPAIFSPISSLLDELLFNDHLLAYLEKNYLEIALTISFVLVVNVLIKFASHTFLLLLIAILLSL